MAREVHDAARGLESLGRDVYEGVVPHPPIAVGMRRPLARRVAKRRSDGGDKG